MTRTLRKPLWRWEPAPYLLLIVLLLITGSIRPDLWPVAYWICFAVTVAAAAILLVVVVLQRVRGPRNPDSAGMLSRLDGLELVELSATGTPSTPVADAVRHQAAIDSAQARAGASPVAVLVPDASRWLALRIRIAVHLVGGDRVYHVGFLPDRATERYNEGLRALAGQGRLVSARASVVKAGRRYAIEIDLGALADVVDAAVQEQPAQR